MRPQSWNRYAYTYNNPLKYSDPSGMLAAREPVDYSFRQTGAGVYGGLETISTLQSFERVTVAVAGEMIWEATFETTGGASAPSDAEVLARASSRHEAQSANTFMTARPEIPLDGPFIADTNVLDQLVYEKKSVGNGDCPALVQKVAGVPYHAYLVPGERVQDTAERRSLKPGTAIATFIDGHYPNDEHHNHMAFLKEYVPGGFTVYDQWKGKPVHVRTIMYDNPNDPNPPSNTGRAFYVIMAVPERFRDYEPKPRKH